MKHWVFVKEGEPSPIELETLALMAKGLSNGDIAKRRNRAMKTVEKTICNLMSETGTHTRLALYTEALARGWLEPPQKLATAGSVRFVAPHIKE